MAFEKALQTKHDRVWSRGSSLGYPEQSGDLVRKVSPDASVMASCISGDVLPSAANFLRCDTNPFECCADLMRNDLT